MLNRQIEKYRITSMKLLEVQSSVRAEKSISRILSREFIQTWQNFHPDRKYQQRDVGINPPAHPTEQIGREIMTIKN
jgi:FMN-dependent NADH-azoreductase